MVVPAPVASLISEVGGLSVPGRLLTERQECSLRAAAQYLEAGA